MGSTTNRSAAERKIVATNRISKQDLRGAGTPFPGYRPETGLT
jgi:hypothetical protein